MTTILVVCTANLCRSPYAAASLRALIEHTELLDGISVVSAGTEAMAGHPICELAAQSLVEHQIPARFFATHSSRSLTVGKINRAGLILTAERAHRSSVNRLVPGSQSRTFTILEAGMLAESLSISRDDGLGSEPPSFADLVERMNTARGSEARLSDPRPWWKLRGSSDLLTIPDGHNISSRAHAATFLRLREPIDAIASYLIGGEAPTLD